jgi:hypothetical protein
MKLTHTQSLILREAAQHEAGLAPLPKLPAAARNAVFRSMLKAGLLTEVPAPVEHVGRGWRQDEAGAWIAFRITDFGLISIGLEPAGLGTSIASYVDVGWCQLDRPHTAAGALASQDGGAGAAEGLEHHAAFSGIGAHHELPQNHRELFADRADLGRQVDVVAVGLPAERRGQTATFGIPEGRLQGGA